MKGKKKGGLCFVELGISRGEEMLNLIILMVFIDNYENLPRWAMSGFGATAGSSIR